MRAGDPRKYLLGMNLNEPCAAHQALSTDSDQPMHPMASDPTRGVPFKLCNARGWARA